MDWAPLVELRVIDGIRQQAWRQRLKNFWRLRGIMGGAGAACTRRAQTPLDTLLLSWPISRTGVKSRSDRASARSLGPPTGRHRQSVKPHVRPLAPRPAGVLVLQRLCTSHIGSDGGGGPLTCTESGGPCSATGTTEHP